MLYKAKPFYSRGGKITVFPKTTRAIPPGIAPAIYFSSYLLY